MQYVCKDIDDVISYVACSDWSTCRDDVILTSQISILAVLGSIGLLFAIMFTPHTPENATKRLGKYYIDTPFARFTAQKHKRCTVHTHTHTLSLSLHLTHTHTQHTLSLSISRTHTNTHTHARTRMHTRTRHTSPGYLCAFGGCTGFSLGPLLNMAANIEPRYV